MVTLKKTLNLSKEEFAKALAVGDSSVIMRSLFAEIEKSHVHDVTITKKNPNYHQWAKGGER
jgi:hypothetical protein